MPSTPNRGYVYPSESVDGWYNTFVTMMNAIDTDVAALQPGVLVASIKIKASTPGIRFKGTENSAQDWQIVESAGLLLVQYNTGTEAVPVWVTYLSIGTGGDVKVNTAGKGFVVRDQGNTQDVRINAKLVNGVPVLDAEIITFS